MAIKVTQWSPDTCPCVIQYEWDDSLPDDQRVHTIHNVVKACVYHSDHTHDEVFASVQVENSAKNVAMGIVIDNFDTHTQSVISSKDLQIDVNGKISVADPAALQKSFIPGKEPQVNFGPMQKGKPRAVSVDVPTMTSDEKIQYQQLLDDQLGAGKIVVS